MPIISFNLYNRRFVHEIGIKYSRRILIFEAWLENLTELNIIGIGEVSKGVIGFHEEELKEELGRIVYIPSWKDSDLDRTFPHSFRIETRIPPATFQALFTYDEKSMQLQFTFTSIDEGNMKYGWEPDGSAVDWDVEKQRFEVAESLAIALYRKKKDDDN
jgi:hypothetical protein